MNYTLDAEHIFTLFFIMLGPLKLLVPYAQATRTMTAHDLKILSFKAALCASVIIVSGMFAGNWLLVKWNISPPVLMMVAGIVLLTTAMRIVLPSDAAASHTPAAETPPGIMQVIFPMILPPHGIAVAIVLLAASHDAQRSLLIIGLVLANMFLNLLTMMYVRPVLKTVTPVGMQILFAVLGVLMVALALQIILASLQALHFTSIPVPLS